MSDLLAHTATFGVPSAVATAVINEARKAGYSDLQILGLFANIQDESGFNPTVVGDGGKAVGLFQQHPNYGSVASRSDPAYATRTILVEAKRVGLGPALAPKTAAEFASAFAIKVERPANKEAKGVKRAHIATGYAKNFNILGSSPSVSPTANGSPSTPSTPGPTGSPSIINQVGSAVGTAAGATTEVIGGALATGATAVASAGGWVWDRSAGWVWDKATGLFDGWRRVMFTGLGVAAGLGLGVLAVQRITTTSSTQGETL